MGPQSDAGGDKSWCVPNLNLTFHRGRGAQAALEPTGVPAVRLPLAGLQGSHQGGSCRARAGEAVCFGEHGP